MSLSQLIEKTIDKKLREVSLSQICTIESFDKTKLTANVKPLYKKLDSNGREVDYPILSNLPCVSPFYGNDIFIKPDYKKGDLVLVIFSSFDSTKQLLKQTGVESEALFGKENGFVIGGIKSKLDTKKNIEIDFSGKSVLIKNKNISLEITDKKIIVKSNKNEFDILEHRHIVTTVGYLSEIPKKD